MNFSVRNYRDSDFYPWIEFYSRIYRQGSENIEFFSEYLLQRFKRPGYSAQKDFFVAEREGTIIGYADVIHEEKIKRAVLSGHVLEGCRRRGVGSVLLQHMLRRSQNLGAGTAHVNIRAPESGARLFLTGSGFSPVRSFCDMRLDLINLSFAGKQTAGLEIGRFPKGEEESLTLLQNRIFEGSWGFCPNSVEEIRYYLVLTNCRVDDVLCLKKEGRAIGYSWFHPLPQRAGGAAMRIHMFGVDPDFHGQGWGKKLLLATLERMRERKIKNVELTVDSENTPALSLYKSLDFSAQSFSLWYEKRLSP